jgi:hypothetical protein
MSRRRQSEETTPKKSTYMDLVRALTPRYPSLQYLNFFIEKPSLYPVRVAVLEFQPENVTRIDFDGIQTLQHYLESSSHDSPQHRLYLIEDLDPSYINLLGSYLNVDGTVFASQIRDSHFTGTPFNGHVPKLPSLQDPNDSFTLRYYESRYFHDPSIQEFSSSIMTCANVVRRQITFGMASYSIGRREELKGYVGQVRRNTSFWSRMEKDGGWNGSYLPPLISRG